MVNERVDWLFKKCQELGVNDTIDPNESIAFMLELDKFRHIKKLTKKQMKTCNVILEYLRDKSKAPVVFRKELNKPVHFYES